MQNLYKILADHNEERKKYFLDPVSSGNEIKKVILKLLPDAKVVLFGSAVKREYRPDSDFDVLIITKHKVRDIFSQAKMKVEILKHFPDGPFEIHLVTPEQFTGWYRHFIKKDYLEV